MKKRTVVAVVAAFILVGVVTVGIHVRVKPSVTFRPADVTINTAISVAKGFEPPGTAITAAFHTTKPAESYKSVELTSARHSFMVCKYYVSVTDLRELDLYVGDARHKAARSHAAISDYAAERIAYQYAALHYPNSGRLNSMWVAHPEFDVIGSHFPLICFYDAAGGLAYTPCRCYVYVDPFNGQVFMYRSFDYPLTVSARANVSVSSALSTAKQSLTGGQGNGTLISMDITDPQPEGKERLIYIFKISGCGPIFDDYSSINDMNVLGIDLWQPLPWWRRLKSQQNTYVAAVDAHTGEFVGWDFYIPSSWQRVAMPKPSSVGR